MVWRQGLSPTIRTVSPDWRDTDFDDVDGMTRRSLPLVVTTSIGAPIVKRWTRRAAMAAGGIVAAASMVVVIGMLRWNCESKRLVTRLMTDAGREPDHAGKLPRDARRDALPAPVARYFAFALPGDRRPIRHARLRFAGTFASRPNEWTRFTAEQHVSADPPAFVWDARIDMVPLVPVRVRDSYVGGTGAMCARLGTVIPVVDQHGTPEMAAASLLRFLAEAVWLPTALLPRDGLSWTAIDDSSARVTLTDGPTTVWMDVQFGSHGEIATVFALRHRDVNGTPVLTPWFARHSDYAPVDGMMIPTSGEVAWLPAEGRTPYWRGRVVEATYRR